MSGVVIVGAGQAVAECAIALRAGGFAGPISMIGDEPYGNYNRILLSDVLNGSHEESDIFLNPLPWYEEHGIVPASIQKGVSDIVELLGLNEEAAAPRKKRRGEVDALADVDADELERMIIEREQEMFAAAEDKPYLETFYDPGLGAPEEGRQSWNRALRNLWSKATGWGITANITDCYEALMTKWRPGMKIGLFGFSRGAYTVRCLGGVLTTCGIALTDAGSPIPAEKGGAGASRPRCAIDGWE